MQTLLRYLLLFVSTHTLAYSTQETPQQSLNQHVAFLNQSVDEVINRFHQLRVYHDDVKRYRKMPDIPLRLPSSGPLEEYYYRKAMASNGLTPAETQRVTASAKALWQLLTKLDQTGKALETYVRLKDYQRDNLKQSDALISEMQVLFSQFSRDKEACYQQIQQIYRRYQPYSSTDPYLATEKTMEQVLLSQQQLINALPYYLNEDGRADWPVDQVQKSLIADEKRLLDVKKAPSAIAYPAADMVSMFRTSLLSMQGIKHSAIDDNTFAARQSVRHGNEVYLALLKQYNQDLLASHQGFVRNSQPVKGLLDQLKLSPTFTLEPPVTTGQSITQTVPFQDKPLIAFSTKPAALPLSQPTFQSLNAYVEFINESLRQMHVLQLVVRDYQGSAAYHRDLSRSKQRATLTYSHDTYKVPVSAYQLLLINSQFIPPAYRTSINGQTETLLTILTEMDQLSIELIAYTTQKQYLQDQFQRSDAILDRYAYLFDAFDQKKEQLYRDVRRVYESYPVANPSSSWSVAGKALQKTLDTDNDILFGVKAYLKGQSDHLPNTSPLAAEARALVAAEYQNLKGLPRYGRSNGLCPYSPYEDLAEHSLRFAEMAQTVKRPTSASTRHPYESFYYFANNELIYQYNKFSELAKEKLLKAVNQPDMFAFERQTSSATPSAKPATPADAPMVTARPVSQEPVNVRLSLPESKPVTTVTEQTRLAHDTVYVERTKVDTVYVDRTGQREVYNSLTGFAANNMVLLLDVSGSMDSPYKLPLLKRSIKSLLTLLRPEDHLSIVVYSGKARVALKPTSGANASEIARVIDALESTGDTDGNGGLRLAYKVANKQYIRAGNNRIILATDGEFPVHDEVLQLIDESAHQDIYLTVFTFGRNALTGQSLKKLSSLGKGTYTHVTPENANSQLILEAQAKKLPTR